MTRLEIVLGTRWKDDLRYLHEIRSVRPIDSPLNFLDLRDVFDLVVEGRNLTAQIEEEAPLSLLLALVEGTLSIIGGRSKAIIEFPIAPFEMVLVPCNGNLALSLYSIDRDLFVFAHNLEVSFPSWIAALSRAGEDVLAELLAVDERFSVDPFVRTFSGAVAQLHRTRHPRIPKKYVAPMEIAGATSNAAGHTLHFEVIVDDDLLNYRGEDFFDLHALLVRGSISLDWMDEVTPICQSYPILSLFGVLRRIRELMNLVEAGHREIRCQSPLPHIRFEVTTQSGKWEVLFGASGLRASPLRMSPNECFELTLSLAELIVNDLLSINQALQLNQRFVDLFTDVVELRAWFDDLSQTNKYLDKPEEFLRENAQIRPAAPFTPTPEFVWPFEDVRAIYPREKWHFRARGIHFGGVTNAKEHVLIPTSDALIALDPETGQTRWQATARNKISLASYVSAGEVLLLANEDADVWMVNQLTGEDIAQVSHPECGALLLDGAHYPEVDRLVFASLHARVTGVEVSTGRSIWSHDSGHGYLVGVTFDGPLVCTLSSPGYVLAFHPVHGEELWKVRLGGVADYGPVVHQGRVFAFSHDPASQMLSVHAIYPFTGRIAWHHRFDGYLAGIPDFLGDWLVVPIERHGRIYLTGLLLESHGISAQWSLEIASAGVDRPTHVIPVSLDGQIHGVVRSDRGEMTCFHLESGQVRWRVRDENESGLLFKNVDIIPVHNSIVSAGRTLEIRSAATGEVQHSFGDLVVVPEFLNLLNGQDFLIGEVGQQGQDELTCLSLGHFLALVK